MNGSVSALALCGKAFKNIGSIYSTMRLEAACEAVRIKHLHHFNTVSTACGYTTTAGYSAFRLLLERDQDQCMTKYINCIAATESACTFSRYRILTQLGSISCWWTPRNAASSPRKWQVSAFEFQYPTPIEDPPAYMQHHNSCLCSNAFRKS